MIKKYLVVAFFILIILVVCTIKEMSKENDKALKPNIVRISPDDLFEGDAKKLAPHLGLIAGSVKVDYIGDKEKLGCKYEIWDNGELSESNGIMSTMINGDFHGNISISLKEMINNDLEKSDNMIMITAVNEENGYSSSTKYIKRFSVDYSYSPYTINEGIDFNDENEISVWGLMAQDENVYSEKDTMEETAKQVDWALILKIYLK